VVVVVWDILLLQMLYLEDLEVVVDQVLLLPDLVPVQQGIHQQHLLRREITEDLHRLFPFQEQVVLEGVAVPAE